MFAVLLGDRADAVPGGWMVCACSRAARGGSGFWRLFLLCCCRSRCYVRMLC